MDQELCDRRRDALIEWETRKAAARDPEPQALNIGFYVTVRERPDGGRTGYLVGPFDTHEEALGQVDAARRIAREVNSDAHWYAYGTARVESYGTLPPGRFNDRFGLPPRA